MTTREIRESIDKVNAIIDEDSGFFRNLIENITETYEGFSDGFISWFGNSVVTNKEGQPLLVFHGTGSVNSIDEFKSEFTGKGNDQLGSGFYFSDFNDTALLYMKLSGEEEKLGGTDSPGVISAYLKIENPIYLEGPNLNNVDFDMTHNEVLQIIKYSKILRHRDDSPIGAWHDIWTHSFQEWMISDVARHYVGPALNIENDFFSYEHGSNDFRTAIHNVLGYDGVIQKINNNETHYVAWFPFQIKIVGRAAMDTF